MAEIINFLHVSYEIWYWSSFYAENDSLGFSDPKSSGCSLAHMSKLDLIEQLSQVHLLISKVHAFWAATWLCHVWYQIETLMKHNSNVAIQNINANQMLA